MAYITQSVSATMPATPGATAGGKPPQMWRYHKLTHLQVKILMMEKKKKREIQNQKLPKILPMNPLRNLKMGNILQNLKRMLIPQSLMRFLEEQKKI